MKNKKILIFSLWRIDDGSVGGTEKYTIELAEGLATRYDVTVVSLSGLSYTKNNVNYLSLSTDILSEDEIKSKFSHLDILLDKFTDYVKLVCQDKLLDFNLFDIIISNTQLIDFSEICERKILSIIHTNPEEFDQLLGDQGFEKSVSYFNKFRNTNFVVPSVHYFNLYKDKFCINNLYYIPHAIDDMHSQNSKHFKKDSLNKYLDENCIDKERVINFFIPSRLEIEQKRQDLLLNAISQIDYEHKNINIIFAGFDEHYVFNKGKLLKLQEDLGLGDINTYFVKCNKNQMSLLYNFANIVVLPSKMESFGYAALESMFYKHNIVILSDIPTYKQIGEHVDNVLFFSSGSYPSLASQLYQSIKSITSKNFKYRNLDLLEKTYSRDNWIQRYIDVINL